MFPVKPPHAMLLFYAIALLVGIPAKAAAGYGDIAGTVVDESGGPAANARVALVGRDNRVHREVVADQQGNYQALRVPAGSYVVVARSARSGASASVATEIREGQNVNLPVTLPTRWSVFESTEEPPAPVASGNYLDTVSRGTEITRGQEGGNLEGYTPYAPRGNSAFNALGQRAQDNNYQIDGMDNNENWVRGPVLLPPLGAIESASVSEVYLPPTQGHATGGVVDVITRSGTNQFHGSAFDDFRNSTLDARNFFDGQKPGLTRNQFGASAGGPLQKDSWFWFLDAEALRARQGLTVISTVPTAAQKAGAFGATTIYDPLSIAPIGDNRFLRQPFPGNQIPGSELSPQGMALANLYPDPNLPGAGDNYRYNPSQIQNGSWLHARTDKIISSRSTLFGSISYQRQNLLSPSALPGPFVASDSAQHADAANTLVTAWDGAVSQMLQVSPTLVNELRASINRMNWNGQPLDQGFNPSALLGIPGLSSAGMPVIDPLGFTQLGAAEQVPLNVRSTGYQLEDTVLWKKGRHSFVFGAQAIRREVNGTAPEWTTRGTFLFTPDFTGQPGVGTAGDSMASLLTGYPTEAMRDVPLSPFQIRGWEWAAFAQDEIQIGKRLRIQGGLRYSLDPPVTDAGNQMVNFNYDRTTPALNQFAGQSGVNSYGGLGFNKRTIAPRIGFAFDVFGTGATVLRGGFSKDYDTGAYIAEGVLTQNPPYQSRYDQVNGTFQVGPSLAAGLPAPTALTQFDAASLNNAHAAIYAIEPRDYTPYADQWGLFLEQRLRRKLSLEVAGMGSMGIHLYETFDANQPFPAPTPYPLPRYPYEPYHGRIEYLGFAGGSTYYGGQAKLTGNPAPGLQLLATFRYAKSLDDSTAPGTTQDSRPSTPQYIYNLRGNRSPSPFDIAQRLVLTATYDLPYRGVAGQRSLPRAAFGNWRLATVVTAQSGFPFTPQLAINSLNNGGYQLPDRLASGTLAASQRSYLNWFNTSLDPSNPNRAFAVPALYEYGNSGFDILRGPGLTTVDVSLARTFPLRERLHLETRLDAFNFLNQTNFALPDRLLGVESSGMISHTITPARQMQVVVRLEW